MSKKKNVMIDSFVSSVILFAFVYAVLIVLKNILNFITVYLKREGKIDMNKWEMVALGSAISYIITVLIKGF